MEATTHRIQLALTTPAYRTLNALKKSMGASSITEVIRTTLATFQWLQDRVAEGYDVTIEKNGQKISVTRLLPIQVNEIANDLPVESFEEESAGSAG